MRDTLYLLGFLVLAVVLLIVGREQLPFSTLMTWLVTFGVTTGAGVLLVSLYRVKVELQQSRHELARREAELNFAREVQAALFPRRLPANRGLSFSAICIPAEGISGDFYDIVECPDGRVIVALADISGKGISAAILMANLQARFRALVESCSALPEVCSRLNEHLYHFTEPEKFATFLVLQWRPGSRSVEYVNAGHQIPVVTGSSAPAMEKGGPPLGLFSGIIYEGGEVELGENAQAVLFSDGISEAVNGQDVEFGVERIQQVAEANADRRASELQAAILERVSNWARSEPTDDMTVVIVRVHESLKPMSTERGESRV